SNPRDEEFFRAVRGLRLRQTRIAAFGATRRAGIKAEADRNLEALLRAATPVVTIVGKTWDLHVRDDLRIPLEENLDVIRDSVAFLASGAAGVFFAADPSFAGGLRNPASALAGVAAAAGAGATLVCLCDTRGGALPAQVGRAVDAAQGAVPA